MCNKCAKGFISVRAWNKDIKTCRDASHKAFHWVLNGNLTSFYIISPALKNQCGKVLFLRSASKVQFYAHIVIARNDPFPYLNEKQWKNSILRTLLKISRTVLKCCPNFYEISLCLFSKDCLVKFYFRQILYLRRTG